MTPLAFAFPPWLAPDSEHIGILIARILLTIASAWVVQRLAFLLVWRAERWVVEATHGGAHGTQRARTLGQIARHAATTIVSVWAALHILEILGWDVKPLLVGASILGAALGFGAQFLVRDLIAGAFILVEDQFGVGDSVEINGQIATVEALTLRSTRLRDFQGRTMFVPNGEMKIVVNHSRGWLRQIVDIPISADQQPDRALAITGSVASAMASEPDWTGRLLDGIEVPGIERVGPEGTIVRMILRTTPGPDGPAAARELRRRVLHALAEAGVRTGASREITVMSPPSAANEPDA